ncbi:hypothetical protein ACQ4M3_00365 [Leptolyngbya sp. AN03gr2]|uniref:hypothetical protein n=1 Tax=unclassified Leptolyngbya TaxID=2650499 RepID=UPI003D320630
MNRSSLYYQPVEQDLEAETELKSAIDKIAGEFPSVEIETDRDPELNRSLCATFSVAPLLGSRLPLGFLPHVPV